GPRASSSTSRTACSTWSAWVAWASTRPRPWRPGRGSAPRSRSASPLERGTTIVVVTHDAEVGERLGRAVTIRDGRVGAEGRGGRDFAVVAGDGTVQLPPDVLGDYPPGTLFVVDRQDGSVSLVPNGDAPAVSAPATGARDGVPD